MGIDVWAQNTTKLTHPRITYPGKHGGGTYTGIAVAKLAEIGISAAVFAPAWTFEHFPGHGDIAEQAVWDAGALPKNLDCACGKASEHHPRGKAIVPFARQFAAGSEQFFYTDFARGFGSHRDASSKWLYSGKHIHSQLGAQSILPHMARTSLFDRMDSVDNAVNILSMALEDLPGYTRLAVQIESVMPPGANADQFYDRWLPLFSLDMAPVGSLRFKVRYRPTIPPPGTTASFYLKSTTGIAFCSFVEADGPLIREIEGPILQGEISTTARLIEIGVHIKARPIQERLTIVEINEIHIGPAVEMLGACNIENIRAEQRKDGAHEHWRICWDFSDHNEEAVTSAGLPYSRLTGPFSYFIITIDGIAAKSFALEWIICQPMVELMAGRVVEIWITGMGFQGDRLAVGVSTLQIA